MKYLLRTCVYVLLLSSLSCVQAKCPLRDWLPNWPSKKNIALQQAANEVRRSGRQLHPALAAAIEKRDRRLVSSELAPLLKRSEGSNHGKLDEATAYAQEQLDALKADFARLAADRERNGAKHWWAKAFVIGAMATVQLIEKVVPATWKGEADSVRNTLLNPSADNKRLATLLGAGLLAYEWYREGAPDSELEEVVNKVNDAEKVLHDLKDQKDNIS